MSEKKTESKRPKRYTILNNKAIKKVVAYLEEHFGFTGKFEYALILSSKEKLYAVTREVFDLPVERLKVNSFGVYFAEYRHEQVRLSIEGSQLIGPSCTKNVLELTLEESKQWMAGIDIPRASHMQGEGFVLIKHGSDFLGCGRLNEEKLWNFVPKNRRIKLE